jgi:lysophospholipase L1-like esterase
MKRAACFVLAASALTTAAFADAALPLYIGGRAVPKIVKVESGSWFTPDAEATTYTYQWPGVYFEAAFTGDRVAVKVDDTENNLYVWIDGVHKLTLTRPGKTTVALKDLGAGRHVVRLEKASETQGTTGRFEGFTVPEKADVLPAPTYTRAIEFIGDSYTVGYGNQSRGQTCTTDDVRDTTDTSRAWGPAVAKHFNAAYRINAFSGRGIVRNYNGIAAGDTLPYLYKFALFDHSVAADDAGWTPDVVIVGLGTNDFSTPLNPGEKWATRDALHADYVRTYADFVKSLRAKYPNAHIVMMAPDNNANETANNMKAAAALAQSEGVADLETVIFTGLDWMACHYHPSLKDEDILSKLVIERLNQLPKFAPAVAAQ